MKLIYGQPICLVFEEIDDRRKFAPTKQKSR